MRRLTTLASLALIALALTAAGAAGHGRSHHAAKRLAAHHPALALAVKACRAERKADPAAFKTKYGDHAFRKCVKAGLPAARAKVRQAVKDCQAERTADPAAFRAKYGNKRHRHAFERCVRAKLAPAPAP